MCLALGSHIDIRGIEDMEYLDEVIEINENSRGEMGCGKIGKGVLKRTSKRTKSTISKIGIQLILSCQWQQKREEGDTVCEQADDLMLQRV